MQIEKARLLIQQERYELAEKELRGALATAPDDAQAHALLAICVGALGRREEALSVAQRAVQCGPEWGFTHYVLAGAYDQLDRFKEAETAIAEALRLDPEDADYHARLSGLHLQQRRWEAALAAAEAGLALDAQNGDCLNFRVMALNKLGRADEARAASHGALSVNPDDARTQASAGWHEIEHGDPVAAMAHFREALRIDSSLTWAREGIVEALKARNPLYRLMLKYFLWTSRLQGRTLWGLVIGGFVLSRFLRTFAKQNPEMAPFVWLVLGPYVAFCVMTWFADPLFNLMLRLHPVGRVALSRGQTLAANAFGGLAAGALVMLGAWWGRGTDTFAYAALALGALVIPVSKTLSMDAPRHRRALGIYSGVMALLGGAMVAASIPDPNAPGLGMWAGLLLLGLVAFSWIANALEIRT